MTDNDKLTYRKPAARDANAPPRQLELDFTHDPRDKWEVVRIGAGPDVFLELRRRRS